MNKDPSLEKSIERSIDEDCFSSFDTQMESLALD